MDLIVPGDLRGNIRDVITEDFIRRRLKFTDLKKHHTYVAANDAQQILSVVKRLILQNVIVYLLRRLIHNCPSGAIAKSVIGPDGPITNLLLARAGQLQL